MEIETLENIASILAVVGGILVMLYSLSFLEIDKFVSYIFFFGGILIMVLGALLSYRKDEEEDIEEYF